LLRRGAAAGGKNFLITNVVALIPKEDVIQLSGMSATGLVYFGGDETALQHKLIVVVEAAALAQRANGDENPALILVRSLLSEGRIDRLVTVPQRNGPPTAVHIHRRGPVAVMMTSARDNVESEMLTRVLVCDADESPEQSERVLTRKLNQGEKLGEPTEEAVERWRALQRWLALDRPYRVTIPFEAAIHQAYLELIKEHREILQQLRIRRDITGLLIGVQASAVLHKANRQIDHEGRLVATLDDYRNAWFAFNTGVSALYGARVRKEIVALVKAAEEMEAELYDENASHGAGGGNPSVEITAAAMRQALGVGSNSTATNRLNEAIDQRVLKEDHDRPNRGRATPRAFWLLKTSKDLEKNDGTDVFPPPKAVEKFLGGGGPPSCDRHAVHADKDSPENPSPENVEKNLEERGTSDCDVGAVHAVQAPPENGEAQTPYTAHLSQSQTPPSQENFSNSTLEPFEVDGVEVVYCQTYDQAKACISEMIADAGERPIALDLETCPIPSERERLAALLEEREAVNAEAIAFRKTAKKAKTPQAEVDAVTEAANARLKALDSQIDYAESAGLDPWRSDIRLIQLYGGKARAAVVAIMKAGAEALELLQGVDAVAHGALFDLGHLGRRGVNLAKVHDSQQAARLTIGASKCSLARAVKHYCKTDLDKDLQTSDWAASSLSEEQIRYAARDVIWLWRLCGPLFKDLGPQVSAYKTQIAAAPAIARMNNAGIGIDLDRHAGTLRALAEQDAIACAGYRDACLEIGRPDLAMKVPRSDGEVAAFLKAVLSEDELAHWKRIDKPWELSTARPELRKAIHYSPVAPLIELSTLDGLRLSFGEPLRFLVSPATGRVHPRYQIAGAPSGRSSCARPNIQGAPRDPRIRAVFRAGEGYVLAASDYHCMELLAAACFFDDPQLIAVFERGDDPHTLTASHVARRPPETITSHERSKAKAANFGIIYGIAGAGLIEQVWKNFHLRVGLAEAESLIATFERLYPVLIAHRREYARVCQLRGAIIICAEWREGRGRIVPIARLPKDQSPQTCAYSYPIQGICADIAMKALTEIDRKLREDRIDGRLVGWIHDELIVEAREADIDRVTGFLKRAMERAFIDVFAKAPLNGLVEVHVGSNWAAVKEKKKTLEEQP
jgi:DNA polymerase-1